MCSRFKLKPSHHVETNTSCLARQQEWSHDLWNLELLHLVRVPVIEMPKLTIRGYYCNISHNKDVLIMPVLIFRAALR